MSRRCARWRRRLGRRFSWCLLVEEFDERIGRDVRDKPGWMLIFPSQPKRQPAVAENGSLAILLLTFFTYLPSLRNGFIWDDDNLVTANPLIRMPDGLYRFWCTTQAPDSLQPLTSSTWSVGVAVRGERTAFGYHTVNILLHAFSAVLWWRVLTRLKIPLAWLAAAPVCPCIHGQRGIGGMDCQTEEHTGDVYLPSSHFSGTCGLGTRGAGDGTGSPSRRFFLALLSKNGGDDDDPLLVARWWGSLGGSAGRLTERMCCAARHFLSWPGCSVASRFGFRLIGPLGMIL